MPDHEKITALIILPKYYNPDNQGHRKAVERRKCILTAKEITKLFADFDGGCTLHWDPKTGFWGKHGKIMQDDIVLLEVDIPADGKQRLIKYARDVLKRRFQQEAIYIKFLPYSEVNIV